MLSSSSSWVFIFAKWPSGKPCKNVLGLLLLVILANDHGLPTRANVSDGDKYRLDASQIHFKVFQQF